MHQFDVYENPSANSRAAIPLLLVIQHDRAGETGTVVVAGLAPLATARPMTTSSLYPVINVAGSDFVLLTPNLAALPRKLLQIRVTNVERDDRRIIGAIDMLFTGV